MRHAATIRLDCWFLLNRAKTRRALLVLSFLRSCRAEENLFPFLFSGASSGFELTSTRDAQHFSLGAAPLGIYIFITSARTSSSHRGPVRDHSHNQFQESNSYKSRIFPRFLFSFLTTVGPTKVKTRWVRIKFFLRVSFLRFFFHELWEKIFQRFLSVRRKKKSAMNKAAQPTCATKNN